MQKRDKEAKKNQKIVDIKEIRLSLNIDTNDFNTKVGQAKKFLSKGDKVKVSIRFRGREMAHTDLGLEVQKKLRRRPCRKPLWKSSPNWRAGACRCSLPPLPRSKIKEEL